MPLFLRNWTKFTAKKLFPTPPLPLRIRSRRFMGLEVSASALARCADHVCALTELHHCWDSWRDLPMPRHRFLRLSQKPCSHHSLGRKVAVAFVPGVSEAELFRRALDGRTRRSPS